MTAHTAHTEDTQTLREMIDLLRSELAQAQAREARAQKLEVIRMRVFEEDRARLLFERTAFDEARAQLVRDQEAVALAQKEADHAPGRLRKRIIALLADYPQGLDRHEIQHRVGTEKNLGDTLVHMSRPGEPLMRTGKGRYTVRLN